VQWIFPYLFPSFCFNEFVNEKRKEGRLFILPVSFENLWEVEPGKELFGSI